MFMVVLSTCVDHIIGLYGSRGWCWC